MVATKEHEPQSQCTNPRRSYVPSSDIVEVEGEFELHLDLPGASPESIKVNYENGNLSIDAEVPDRQPTGTKYLLREYGVGDFHRSFQVSKAVDSSRIDATYKNGVLSVKLPKSEETKARKIEVKA